MEYLPFSSVTEGEHRSKCSRNLSDTICQNVNIENNISPALGLLENIGIIVIVTILLICLASIVKLKQIVDGKNSKLRVNDSLLYCLPEYETVLQMEEEGDDLPSYSIAVGLSKLSIKK